MQAIWNVNATAKLSREANLRNVCRQIEQEYVDWHRFIHEVTCQQWPAIGELGRYGVTGVVVNFLRHRSYVEVRDSSNRTVGKVNAKAGMAADLYILAGSLEDVEDCGLLNNCIMA